jgi:thiamine-monophosphate kinase
MASRILPRGELTLLSQIRQRSKNRSFPALRLGIGDDCAILRPEKNEEIIVTTDLSLENVHFRRDWHRPEVVGHRCLTRGLSDIAAMGGRPLAAFLSLAVPESLIRNKRGQSWLERFYDGLLALAKSSGVPLAGGDLAQNPTITADIVLVGAVSRNRALLRSGAKPGDSIYVTGSLGGSAAELLMLGRQPGRFARARKTENHPHLFPLPRLSVGAWLNRRATAAIDISDGLSTDLAHLCEESRVAAEIDAYALPIHPLAQKIEKKGLIPSAQELAFHGGEDYELLFTAPSSTRIPKQIAGISIHKIGRMVASRRGKPAIALLEDGKTTAIAVKGWQHFKSSGKNS